MTGYMARARIVALMAEQQITAPMMCARLNCTPAYLASLLGGRRPLTRTELRRFCEILDVSLEELTDGAWYGCPECGGVGPQPVHTRVDCPAANGEQLLPAVPRGPPPQRVPVRCRRVASCRPPP